MAINMTFTDYVTPVPADWLNNVNRVVNATQFPVASIATLRANTSTAGNTGVQVEGFYTPGDGGGGTYIVNSTDHTSPDNGGTIIVDAAGQRWYLQYTNSVSLPQFGTKGDGTTDDTVAVQNAFTWCSGSGVKLIVPIANVSYRLTATINMTGGFQVLGAGVVPYSSQNPGSVTTNVRGKGSWFYLNHTAKGFNIFNSTAFNRGRLEGIGTYRDQPTPNGATAFTPTIADWDIYVNQSGMEIYNVCLLNPYNAIYVSVGAVQVNIDNVFGQPLHYGIMMDNCFDVVRINRVHWWPYWSGASGVYTWTKANASGLYSTRVDNPVIQSYFSIYMTGWLISGNGNGSLNNALASDMGFDGCSNGITVDGLANNAVCRFANFYAQGDTAVANNFGLIVSATSCVFDFVNSNFTNFANNAIRLQGTGCTVRFGSGITMTNYNTSGSGFSAVDAETGFNVVTFAIQPTIQGGGNGPFFTPNGTSTISSPLTKGFVSGTTNGAGQLVVGHNAGVAPSNVTVTMFGTTTPYFAMTSGYNSTGFTITFFNTSGATVSGVGVAFSWKCEF